jgi:hypothetical protein
VLWDHNCSTLLLNLYFSIDTAKHCVRENRKFFALSTWSSDQLSTLPYALLCCVWFRKNTPHRSHHHTHHDDEMRTIFVLCVWIQIKTIKIRLDRWETNSNFINELHVVYFMIFADAASFRICFDHCTSFESRNTKI